MARSKRNRTALDDDSDNTPDSDGANQQGNASKRARTLSRDRRSEGDWSQSHTARYSPMPTDDEDDDEESSGDEERIERATQAIFANQRGFVNRPADYGVIESVTCYNFMCHVHLSVKLGPLINFIIGHNGSGKSAILTAITLCLGGKASTTNRGQALRNFIRNGAESSTVAVKLKNGEGGYQTELYGESIIVERSFSLTGSSGFKLKSAAGRIISSKKSELDQICDYFALQIDNPLNVLSQDLARQFLNNSSSSEKYKFFIRGIQLEQLDNDYQLIERSVESMEPQLLTAKEDLAALEDQMQSAKHAFTVAERTENLVPRLTELSHQMAWAQVEEQERDLQNLRQEAANVDHEVEWADRKVEDASKKFDEADIALENAQTTVQSTQTELEPVQAEHQQVAERVRENRRELQENQTQHRQVRDHMKTVGGAVRRHKEAIVAEQNRLRELDGGRLEAMMTEIEDARRELDRLKTEQAEHASGMPQLTDERTRLSNEVQSARGSLQAKEGELHRSRQLIRELQHSSGGHLQAFGPNMERLLRVLQNEREFREKPVGPIGNHIVLKDTVWLNILDKSFGAILSSFIVTSKADQSLLQNIMRRERLNFQIMIGNRATIDVRQHEPEAGFATTLRALEIDNELVRAQLIINQSIEQTLLVQNMEEGMRLMSRTPPPKNVKQCFCINHHRRGWGLRIGLRAGGREVGTSPVEPLTGRARFRIDMQAQISLEQGNEQAIMSEVRVCQERVTSLRTQLQQVEQQITQHNRVQSNLRSTIGRAQLQKERLEEQREQAGSGDDRLAGLEELLAETETELEIQQNAYESCVVNKDRLNEQAGELKRENDAMDLRVKEAETKLLKATKRRDQLEAERSRALRAKNDAVLDGNTVKNKVHELHERVQEQAKVVEEFIEGASRICLRVRVPEDETSDSLDAKMIKLDEERERHMRECGASKTELATIALAKTQAFDEAYKEHRYTNEIKELWKSTLQVRRQRWKRFRAIITIRARAAFNAFLQERGFRGNLRLKHGKRELDLLVQPDESVQQTARGTKTLSGGEKSFSTISFLLALWDAMGSPIRCLDEFDVFMDNVNRDVAMNMMIQAARHAAGRQYILITPNSMGSLAIGEDMKIIKLTDPERGQTTLPFGTVPAG